MRIKSIKFVKEKEVFKTIDYLSNGFTIIHNYPEGETVFLELQAKELARVLENRLSSREISLLKEMIKNKF